MYMPQRHIVKWVKYRHIHIVQSAHILLRLRAHSPGHKLVSHQDICRFLIDIHVLHRHTAGIRVILYILRLIREHHSDHCRLHKWQHIYVHHLYFSVLQLIWSDQPISHPGYLCRIIYRRYMDSTEINQT